MSDELIMTQQLQLLTQKIGLVDAEAMVLPSQPPQADVSRQHADPSSSGMSLLMCTGFDM